MSDNEKPKVGIVMGTGAGGFRALTGAGQAEVKRPVPITPDVAGLHGCAWKCNVPVLLALRNLKLEDDACLGMWVIEAPWAHPIWHSYLITLVHLRPMPNKPPPIMHLAEATHEFLLYATDPDADREAIIRGQLLPFEAMLTPVNFGAQLVEVSDDLAMARIVKAIQEICDGRLSPDTDHQRQWVDRFGNNMIKKEFR
ncbi:hypothetical protein [Bradyrhizobium paxllaeri]|uniref:hypothetical protein n=1 Tax=Bradyrhizobium paxllaeri TaxID=190148 RepID=UPI00081039D7|nr:hypothetical protein [Bradyrhizobium paxllaeri]